jgi:hypothetical protein
LEIIKNVENVENVEGKRERNKREGRKGGWKGRTRRATEGEVKKNGFRLTGKREKKGQGRRG